MREMNKLLETYYSMRPEFSCLRITEKSFDINNKNQNKPMQA